MANVQQSEEALVQTARKLGTGLGLLCIVLAEFAVF